MFCVAIMYLTCKILGEELIYICKRHLADEDIEHKKTGQKALRLEAVSTKYLSTSHKMKDRKARTCSQ